MKKLFIVMYHYVRDLQNSRYPAIKGLDYALFKEQIDFLQAHFNIIKMEDVINCYASERGGFCNKNLPENACLLTFDDGYIDNYTFVFPYLKEKGIAMYTLQTCQAIFLKRRVFFR